MVAKMTPLSTDLSKKDLFIQHLAQRLQAMESGSLALHPVAYRLFARRLRQAMAGYPEARLAVRLAEAYPAVAHAMADRFFDTHGRLPGPHARAALSATKTALRRAQRR